MITSVLFDLDGTLINTNEHIISALIRAFEEVSPLRKTREDIAMTFGIPLDKAIRNFDPENWELILKTYHYFANQKGYSDVFLFPKAQELLANLKENNIKTAIVTSRRKVNAVDYLSHFKLMSYFDTIIGPEDCQNHKPHPEPIEKALKELNERPENALMIGDSPFDILSANSANVKSIAVSYTALPFQKLLSAKPTYVIDSLDEILSYVKK